MGDFTGEDLSGSRFEDVHLTGARFHDVDLRDARLRWVDLTGARIVGSLLVDVTIDAEIERLVVNGVDVVPLVEAELDRRHPERAHLRPDDADGFRAAWPVLEDLWRQTVDRARALPPGLLHERVDDEWSFIETLRHLAFATDAWIARTLLGEPSPWHPLDLPFDEMPDIPGVPRDRVARPTLEEVLALRESRQAVVREVLASLTDEQLGATTEPVAGPGYPPADAYAVRRCLETVLSEEWHHRRYSERDLDTLATRAR